MSRSTALLRFVALAALVLVVGTWWRDADFGSRPATEAELGRLCGLLAAYVVVTQLFLRARVPFVEQRVPQARLTAWHRRGGTAVVALAAAHAALITWGYSGLAGEGVVSEAGTLIVRYPDVLMATVALGLFAAVGVVSVRAVRRRLRYETWFHLHLYVYLAIGFAIAHQLVNGKHFANDPVDRALWLAMYGTVGLTLVWFRIVVPLVRFHRHGLHVVAVVPETDTTTSVVLQGTRLADLGASAGQYFRWRFLARDSWWSANPYSLSEAPTGGRFRITVKAAGDHSRRVRQLRVGTRVLAEGPLGAFGVGTARGRGVLFVAGGVGITPIRALLEALAPNAGPVTLIYRAGTAAEVLFRDELDALAEGHGAEVIYLVGPREDVGPGLTDVLESLPGVAERDVFLCGPAGFTASVGRTLRSLGVPSRRIREEAFDAYTS